MSIKIIINNIIYLATAIELTKIINEIYFVIGIELTSSELLCENINCLKTSELSWLVVCLSARVVQNVTGGGPFHL